MIDKNADDWKSHSLWLKCWLFLNFYKFRPARRVAWRIQVMSHVTGFLFCLLGYWNEAALVGGLIMLATAYYFCFLTWQGDKYGIWYDPV